MLGRTKKQKIIIAIVISVFIAFACYGVFSYFYKSLTTVENDKTTENGYVENKEEEEDKNFLHFYMESIYNRLGNGEK